MMLDRRQQCASHGSAVIYNIVTGDAYCAYCGRALITDEEDA